ncbi:DUF3343 domain-containing protein [bacterium]|nr:DUF3343 domain-containing protein [bacterium]
MQFIITFESTHQAMNANKLLTKRKLKCEIIPTPREISSECGFSILGQVEDLDIIKNDGLLSQIKYDKIYIKPE